MKCLTFLFGLLFSIHLAFSQPLANCNNSLLCPKGFSRNGSTIYYLEGGIDAYLVYKDPDLNVEVPESLPYQQYVPYKDLLLSGVKSLLFEYKNYQGMMDLTSYMVFGLGNYNIITTELLQFANEKILPDQKCLKSIYGWIKPYYKRAFKTLTYEEQKLLFEKIGMAEKYVLYVLNMKNKQKYAAYLEAKGLTEDTKLESFLKRRIDKRQWTIEDCNYWLRTLRNDFTPLLKKKENPASHYQITDSIQANLMIACNHKGDYYLLDSSYNQLTKQHYKFMSRGVDGRINAYMAYDYWSKELYHIDSYGKLSGPHKNE